MVRKFAISLAAALALVTGSAAAQTAGDKYIGYYYPAPTSSESYESSLQPLPNIDKAQRVVFFTIVAQGTLQSAYRVPYAVFTKGDRSDHMIIVALQGGEMATIYRIRAVLANMTTMARLSSFFTERTVAEDANFFDHLEDDGLHQAHRQRRRQDHASRNDKVGAFTDPGGRQRL